MPETKENITENRSEQVIFLDSCQPQLKAGKYTVSVTLEVKADNSNDRFSPANKEFYVDAPRFSLPPSDIYSCYPAKQAEGAFGTSLPHIVFNRRTLPWERAIGVENASWMGLLVLTEDELKDGVTLTNRSLKTLLANNSKETYGPRLDIKDITLLEDPETECQVVDISSSLFRKIMPQKEDLPYLAHVRQVYANKNKESADIVDGAYFSTVIANRLPAESHTPIRHTALLVSFEGFDAYFNDPASAAATTFTMVVLTTWNFTVFPGKTFRQLCENLHAGPMKFNYGENTDEKLRKIYDLGYALMPFQTRNGNADHCWYRGPFNPNFIPANSVTKLTANSDELLRYDNKSSIFDVSYAAAWQLGRLLALKDNAFSTAYHQWKVQEKRDRLQNGTQQAIMHLLGNVTPLTTTHAQNMDGIIRDHLLKIEFKTVDSAVEKAIGSQPPPAPSLGNRSERKLHELFEEFYHGAFLDTLAANETMSHIEYELSQGSYAGKLKQLVQEVFLKKHAEQETTSPLANSSQGDREIPSAITDWLGRLSLLHGVPLNYLVPNTDFLSEKKGAGKENEAIGTFYIDYDWVEALISGALSIVPSIDSTSLLNIIKDGKLLHRTIHLENEMELPGDVALPASAELPQGLNTHITGFILRSQLVASWKGMQVYAKDHKGWMGAPLRMERIDNDMFLCLFSGKFTSIVIIQPFEGTHFGFTGDGAAFIKQLRNEMGMIEKDKKINVLLRDTEKKTVNFRQLAASISEATLQPVGPALMAYHLMESPVRYELSIDDRI